MVTGSSRLLLLAFLIIAEPCLFSINYTAGLVYTIIVSLMFICVYGSKSQKRKNYYIITGILFILISVLCICFEFNHSFMILFPYLLIMSYEDALTKTVYREINILYSVMGLIYLFMLKSLCSTELLMIFITFILILLLLSIFTEAFGLGDSWLIANCFLFYCQTNKEALTLGLGLGIASIIFLGGYEIYKIKHKNESMFFLPYFSTGMLISQILLSGGVNLLL